MSPLAADDPMLPSPFQVRSVRQETHDTFTLDIRPQDGGQATGFSAGQFNMLYVFGIGEVPISISGDPGAQGSFTHTVRAVGAATRAISKLEQGQSLGVRGPFGSYWPVTEAEGNDVVLVAGGIGLAPLRPALYQLLANREKYGNALLLYGARAPRELLYEDEVHQWRGRFDLEVEVTVDRAERGWFGNVGVVTTLIERARFDPESTVAMVCGPEIMMRFTILDLEKRGLSRDRIFISMERNMKCAVGFCGHCQFGPAFICKDGPVFRYDRIKPFFEIREI